LSPSCRRRESAHVQHEGCLGRVDRGGLRDRRYREGWYSTDGPGAALDIDCLREHFADAGLARQKTPERLVIVDALPRTSLGKVRKPELRKEH
jgi:acyl-CoA synthetase (AMP-forming)/AMP-acid ligase II